MPHTLRHGSQAKPVANESDLLSKQEVLFSQLNSFESLLIAFSGGTDSAYLAWAAHRVLGDRALVVTALSPSFSAYDRDHAVKFARELNLNHEFIESHEFENPLYVANDASRCYHCKTELFERLAKLRSERGFSRVAYGVNADDLRDFRPGHRAASEHGVTAPLLDANLAKSDVRFLSRRAGLSTWDRPASPCLASRVAYGIQVTADNLSRIERAESALREFGFRQFRVRFYGETARIEIDPQELTRALEPATARAIAERVQSAGFAHVTIDPRGYRQGSLNAVLITS